MKQCLFKCLHISDSKAGLQIGVCLFIYSVFDTIVVEHQTENEISISSLEISNLKEERDIVHLIVGSVF